MILQPKKVGEQGEGDCTVLEAAFRSVNTIYAFIMMSWAITGQDLNE